MTEAGRRIRFSADFDYWPTPQIVIAYKAGMVEFVRLECAQRAVAKGVAEYVTLADMPSGLGQIVRKRRRKQARNDGAS
jgi:hypothetical protein